MKVSNSDGELSLSFNFAILQSILDALPLILLATSAGALHWFFIMLNHVKCLDPTTVARRCTELLGSVAHHYNAVGGANTHHALLRARYGLYGCPLDTDLFDIDPPPLHTVPASVSTGSSYASVVASNQAGGAGSGISGGPIGVIPMSSMQSAGISSAQSVTTHEDSVFRDLMNLCWSDGRQTPDVGRYLNGLLEVEPLHFTCHATSDGTRMERVDSGKTTYLTLSLVECMLLKRATDTHFQLNSLILVYLMCISFKTKGFSY